MPWSDFIHLHVHTQYSLLDGACRIQNLIETAKKYNMQSLAMTDHGNIFGVIDFYLNAMQHGIKPIIGCEVYIARGSRFEKSAQLGQETNDHFLLLAKDLTGYKNLVRLVSMGYLEGFYYRPRVDKEILSQHSKGLIGMTACLKGEIPNLIQQNRFNDALKTTDEFLQIFGRDNLYLELMDNFIPEQKKVNEGLLKISKELNISIVATNDVHYVTKDMVEAHEALLCIQTQTTLLDPNRMKFQTPEFYFKSPDEMKQLFKELPEAIKNTLEIASRCNVELELEKIHLPQYNPPNGKTKEEYLRELCLEGLKGRYGENPEEKIKERLEYELKTIKDIGFTGYFLIVWDFIHYAKKNAIPVGPGRGSASGSLVSYLLDITDIDPLKYGLLFERFLNPERVSMPDIDIDFCYERRPEVIDYVTDKYGKENVAQIITFGTMLARQAVRDVGRVMGMSYQDVDKIAKLIPPDIGMTLKEALNVEPQLNQLQKDDENVKRLIDIAMHLEGLTRHASVHAAGVVISDKPLTEYLPLYRSSDSQITTGYPMEALEKIGLLKMDFLGLRTLTVIDKAVKIIQRDKGVEINIENIPLDDAKTFKLLSDAHTSGIFQLESAGMKDLLKKLQPNRFEDLISLLALYRPGPIGSGMLDDFMKRRHAKIPVRYDHKKLQPILEETYGIIVFQEQVMRIASDLAGFSLSQADLLRRAMSKKIPEVMERQRQEFVNGCRKNAINEQTSNKIFSLIEYFAGYGFNRSHSAAYALISYRTAYLKANYPVEFMASLLTSERDNTDKIVEYVSEAQRMKIAILGPDVNKSFEDFRVISEDKIRFGLLAIKNIGLAAVESILKTREKFGEFKDLFDLCEKVDTRAVNRKVIESLTKAGAMDCFSLYRAQLLSILDKALESGSLRQRERQIGQLSFFDVKEHSANGFKTYSHQVPDIKEWPQTQLLSFEKDMLGFYITGHPLAKYESQFKRFNITSVSNLTNHKDQEELVVAGIISKLKHTYTRKNNERMAIVTLEDLTGSCETLVFPKAYQQSSSALHVHHIVIVKGRLSLREKEPKLIADKILTFDSAYRSITKVDVKIGIMGEELLNSLKERLSKTRGDIPVYLYVETPSRQYVKILVDKELHIEPSHELFDGLSELLGEERFSLTI